MRCSNVISSLTIVLDYVQFFQITQRFEKHQVHYDLGSLVVKMPSLFLRYKNDTVAVLQQIKINFFSCENIIRKKDAKKNLSKRRGKLHQFKLR